MTATECAACLGRWPAPEHRVADLDLSVVFPHDDQYFPGWTLLVLKHHATELWEIAASERVQLIEEVNAVAQALAQIFHPVKVNYALLGNQLPHIRWHVVPRLGDEPAPGEAVFGVTHAPRRLSPVERDALIERVRAALVARP